MRESLRANSRGLAHWRIQDLEVFTQVVECASFTKAGRLLGMSTSAISKHLAALEQHVGARLLDRTSRLMSMTSDGREFYALASSVCEQLREAEIRRGAPDGRLHGTLRVSIPTAAVEMGILGDLVDISAQHPELNMEIYLSDRAVDLVGRALDASLFLTDVPDRHMGDVVLGNMIDDTPAAKTRMTEWIAQQQACDVYVVIANDERRADALAIAQELRDEKWRVDFSLTTSKVGKQFQIAEQLGAKFAVVVGDEWPNVKIKTLANREEITVPHESLISKISPLLAKSRTAQTARHSEQSEEPLKP